MCMWYSHTSPASTRAKASWMLALPVRSDFTSVPVRTSPASTASSMKYSWRARRLLAIRCSSSAMGYGIPAAGQALSRMIAAAADPDEEQPDQRRGDLCDPGAGLPEPAGERPECRQEQDDPSPGLHECAEAVRSHAVEVGEMVAHD